MTVFTFLTIKFNEYILRGRKGNTTCCEVYARWLRSGFETSGRWYWSMRVLDALHFWEREHCLRSFIRGRR